MWASDTHWQLRTSEGKGWFENDLICLAANGFLDYPKIYAMYTCSMFNAWSQCLTVECYGAIALFVSIIRPIVITTFQLIWGLSGDYPFPQAPNPPNNILKPLLHFRNLLKDSSLLYINFAFVQPPAPPNPHLTVRVESCQLWVQSGLMLCRQGVFPWLSRLPQYIEYSPSSWGILRLFSSDFPSARWDLPLLSFL